MTAHTAGGKCADETLTLSDIRNGAEMLVVTTPELQGFTIRRYVGVVTGEAILGANIFRDLFAGIRDIFGGRSAAYEE